LGDRTITNWLRTVAGAACNRLLNALIGCGISPNQITCIGLALVFANCAIYLLHQNLFFFGLGLALSYGTDALDGVVARRTGQSTKFGGYLDAVVDRYQEMASYFILGFVNGWWLPVFLLTTGALMVSYNKAAVAIEIPIDDKAWPDLMERVRRALLFCAALILDDAVYVPAFFGGHLALIALYYLAALAHFTALQRFLRARRRLIRHDSDRLSGNSLGS
jgi:phosphatidylglycerophosphate synthase